MLGRCTQDFRWRTKGCGNGFAGGVWVEISPSAPSALWWPAVVESYVGTWEMGTMWCRFVCVCCCWSPRGCEGWDGEEARRTDGGTGGSKTPQRIIAHACALCHAPNMRRWTAGVSIFWFRPRPESGDLGGVWTLSQHQRGGEGDEGRREDGGRQYAAGCWLCFFLLTSSHFLSSISTMSEDTSCSALVLWRPWPFDPVPRSSPTTAIKEAPELTEIVPPSSPEVTLSVFHDATNVLQGPSSSSSTHHAPKVAVNTHYLSLIRGPQVSPSCHTIRLPPSPGLQHLPRTSISWPTSLTLPTSAHSLPYNAPINEDIVGGDPQDIVMDEPSDAAEVANQMDVDEERVPEGGGSSFTPALVTTSSYQGGDPGEHAPMTAADTVLHLSSTTPLQPVMGSWTTSDPISLSTPKRPGVFLPPKRTPVSVSDHAPNTPIAKVDQWRVGKRPGHQGSHMHNKRRSEALSEDEVS